MTSEPTALDLQGASFEIRSKPFAAKRFYIVELMFLFKMLLLTKNCSIILRDSSSLWNVLIQRLIQILEIISRTHFKCWYFS